MKHIKSPGKLVFALGLILFLINSYVQASDHSNEYVLVFSAEWCAPCKIMEKKVWPNQLIVDTLSNFHSGKAYHYIDDKDSKQFDKWRVSALPTVIIYDKTTSLELRRHVGYMDVLTLKNFLLKESKRGWPTTTEYSGEYVEKKKGK